MLTALNPKWLNVLARLALALVVSSGICVLLFYFFPSRRGFRSAAILTVCALLILGLVRRRKT
jgi:hypothetical protein